MEYNKDLVSRSQQLRKNMTKEEALLWYRFLKSYPIQFRRQYVIENYIVDFYCHKGKLVVELDGSQHYDEKNQEYDQIRTKRLSGHGIKVLRFSNLDVLRNFDSVCETIHRTVSQAVEGMDCQEQR